MNGANEFIETNDLLSASGATSDGRPVVLAAYAQEIVSRAIGGSILARLHLMAPDQTGDQRDSGSVGLFAAEQARHFRFERIEVGERIVGFLRRLVVWRGVRLVGWRGGGFLRPLFIAGGRGPETSALHRRRAGAFGAGRAGPRRVGRGTVVTVGPARGSVFAVAGAGSAFAAGNRLLWFRGGAAAPASPAARRRCVAGPLAGVLFPRAERRSPGSPPRRRG